MKKSVQSGIFRLLAQILAFAIVGPITVCLLRLYSGREISLVIALRAYAFSVTGLILCLCVACRKDRQL